MKIAALFLVVFAAGAWAQVPREGVAGRDYPFVLGTEHGWGNYTYRDDETGYYGGFIHDLIDVVCDAAEVKCRTVVDDWNNCVQGRPGGKSNIMGQGNQNGWYTAYIGAFPTVDRIHFAQFSMPFSVPQTAYIWKRKGDTAAFGGGYNFANGKLGFVSGWYNSPGCVNKCLKDLNEKAGSGYTGQITGYPLSSANVANDYLEFDSVKLDFLTGTTLDGMIASASFKDDAAAGGYEIEEVVPCTCALAGASAIARTDNSFIDDVWNKGFDLIMRNGAYKKLCADADVKYGEASIRCVEPSYDWSN